MATYPESVLHGQIVKVTGEQLKTLYKSIHNLDALPPPSTANIYAANVNQVSGSTRNSQGQPLLNSQGQQLLTQLGEDIVDAAGGLEDDATGDTAMEGNSAQVYLNDKGITNDERKSFLLTLKGALTAAFIQPWTTWTTTEKRIEKGKAQRRLINEKDKSDLADEVLQILTDDGRVDSDAFDKLIDRRIDDKTKGLRAENNRLKAKIKQLEKDSSSSKNDTRGQGGAAGKKKLPQRNGRKNDQRKNQKSGGKHGQDGSSNASKGGKKDSGGNQSSKKWKKNDNKSSTRGNKSTSRSTQK